MKPGWEARNIGDVCEVIAGQSPNGSSYNSDGFGLPFYQGKKDFGARQLLSPNTWTTEITKRAIAGDILMSVRAPVGPVNEATQEICIGRGLAAIRAGEDVDRNYLWYSLLWLQPRIKGSTGAVFDSINKRGIERLPLPLPPLEEQRRIVAILDEAFEGLDRARANAEANLTSARELFESALGSLFDGGSAGWATAPLQQVVEPDCTLSYGIVQPGDDKPDGLPIVRPTDLGGRLITLDGLKRIDPANAAGYGRTKLRGGEILLCVRGSTGAVSVAAEELRGANVTRGIVPVRFDRNRIDHRLGYYQFLSKPVQDQIRAKTYGAALMQINISDLRQLTISVPPTDEQGALLERIESVTRDFDELVAGYEAKTADCVDLRQSILQRAFAGELT